MRVIRERVLPVLLALGAFVVLGANTAAAQCPGDCNGDGFVRINELVRAVGILLGSGDIEGCRAVDANNNGSVSVSELVRAVNSSLLGCNPPPTATPSPTPEVFSSTCNLSADSELNLNTGLIVFPLEPTAQLTVECTEQGATTSGLAGDFACECKVDNFDAVNIPGIGDVCIEPFAPCETRVASCEGGTGVDVTIDADHNIGQCTGTANCESLCDARCDGLGAGFFRQASTCEDFCLGGSNDGATCGVDTDCPGGSCGGRDGGTDGQICECVCARPGGGDPAGAGALACGLGVSISVELDNDQICGNVPPSIVLAPLCGELTTGTSIGSLLNVANSPGTMIGPSTLEGTATTCSNQANGSASGMTLVGHLAFFGSAVGDILAETVFACE